MCNNCKVSFKDFYYKNLEEAISQKQAKHRSNGSRKQKAREDYTGIKNMKVKDLPANVKRFEIKLNKFKDHYENDEKELFIEYNTKTKKIIRFFCSCLDFKFKNRWILIQNDLSTKQIPLKYQQIESSKKKGKYKNVPPDQTNRERKIYMCKHILAVLNDIDLDTGEIKTDK